MGEFMALEERVVTQPGLFLAGLVVLALLVLVLSRSGL